MENKPIREEQPVEKKPAENQKNEKQPVRKPAGNQKKLSRKKAQQKKRLALMLGGAIAAAAVILIGFRLTTAFVGGQAYRLTEQKIDLSNSGVSSAAEIGRLKGLKEARLSGNAIVDASPLAGLTECEYIDLTGNPVSAQSYSLLRNELPGCLILCEAEDDETTHMALGGYELPDAEALIRVFSAHHALETVDLRGSMLSQEEIGALRAALPHISFISLSDGRADAVEVNAQHADAARRALARITSASEAKVTGCAFTLADYRTLVGQIFWLKLECQVQMGGKTYSVNAEEIDLRGTHQEEDLVEQLRLFENLRKVTLTETLPTKAAALKEAMGLEEVNYVYNGSLVSPETKEIDLYGAPGLNAEQLSALLASATGLETVVMNKPDEAMLSVMENYSDRIWFLYETEAFGKSFSTASRVIDLGGAVTDANVAELIRLIDMMPNLEEAHMYESKLSQENMDMLFDSYPEVFFGWTFKMCDGKYTVRTDITAFSTLLGSPSHVFTQKDFVQLRYCKKLLALDLGHNAITNIDFLYNFPNLKLLILADNQISDVTPIGSLKNLTYLEIFLNYDITDYSPLAGLPLTDLNIRCSRGVRHDLDVEDFLAIPTLKRFWASKGHLDEEEIALMREQMPDCEISINNESATKDGWRENDIYPAIVRMFDSRQYEDVR